MTENNFQIYSAAVSDRGLSEKRPQNEDSYLEMKNLGLFAVADGVGGAQAGDVASQMAMEILGEAFINLQFNGDAEDMMKIAIERANSAIYQMSSDLPQLSTMATTIVALHISGNIATIGHVGDSRLYRVDSKGNLYRETQDHSVVEEEVRAGRMTAAQAANHPSRNVISRALGAENSVEVDMKTIMFDGDTRFLLCSDGITRHINDFELRDLLLSNAPPEDVCAQMKEICYSRGAEDNLTAVIINIAQQPETVNSPNSFTVPPINAPIIEEEATVATPRTAPVEAPPPIVEDDYDEVPTRGLEMPASMQAAPATEPVTATENFSFSNDQDDEAYLMEEPAQPTPQAVPEDIEIHETIEMPSTMSFQPAEKPVAATPKPVEAPKDFTSYDMPEKNDSGAIGKLLSAIIWLAVGALIGAAAVYLWQTMNAKPAEVPALTPQSNNIPKSSIDTLKYRAETAPDNIIKQYETALPKDAQDFYVLGRAFLKLKNYEEAKKNFILARNNLREVKDAETRVVLDADITQGLMIAQDIPVQAAYERVAKTSPLVETVNQTNSNQ